MTNGSTEALLVMDFQNSVVGRLGTPEVLAAAARAVKGARAAGRPVIYVRVAFRAGFPEVSDRNLMFTRVAGSGADMTPDGTNTQITDAVAPGEDELIVT